MNLDILFYVFATLSIVFLGIYCFIFALSVKWHNEMMYAILFPKGEDDED